MEIEISILRETTKELEPQSEHIDEEEIEQLK